MEVLLPWDLVAVGRAPTVGLFQTLEGWRLL